MFCFTYNILSLLTFDRFHLPLPRPNEICELLHWTYQRTSCCCCCWGNPISALGAKDTSNPYIRIVVPLLVIGVPGAVRRRSFLNVLLYPIIYTRPRPSRMDASKNKIHSCSKCPKRAAAAAATTTTSTGRTLLCSRKTTTS